jgi:hypothetical protein
MAGECNACAWISGFFWPLLVTLMIDPIGVELLFDV